MLFTIEINRTLNKHPCISESFNTSLIPVSRLQNNLCKFTTRTHNDGFKDFGYTNTTQICYGG